MPQFKIYSSSAGSGKTYTLTKEYLKLALQTDNPHYFKTILAITFTNDAANEMKERIISALKGFAYPDFLEAKDLKKSLAFLTEIATEMQVPETKLQQRALMVFSKIIYNYSDFSVSTIDKFVNKVTSAFTRELEIPYNYEVDLDTDKLLQNAVDRVLEKVGYEHKDRLSDFVVNWVRQKAEEGKSWGRVGEELAKFAKNLMNENAYPFIHALRDLSMDDFKLMLDNLEKFNENITNQAKSLAKKGWTMIQERGLEESFSGGVKASVASYFKNHTEKLDMSFKAIEKDYMRKVLDDIKWYKEKNNVAIDEIKAELKTLIEQIEDLKDNSRGDYELVKMIVPHIYKLALIQEIEMELTEVKKENNAIHISDTNKKIAEIISTEPVPYIYERVGEKYHHILIDEFQDTSLLQWQNLLPLVENNLSEGHFNLIVGDAKQAIYRWRGGEMEQLVYLYKKELDTLMHLNKDESPFLEDRYEVLERYHTPANLNFNFRSAQEVIQFNNDFFEEIKKTDFGEIYPLFPKIYDETFAQQIPLQNQKKGGHVEIRFLESGDLYRENTFAVVLELIDKALEDGFELGDIAILSRNNNNGKEIANFLKENRIDVISQDSLLLANDEKVRFLVAMLKVIQHPEDKLSRSEAIYLFYKVVKNKIPDADENFIIKELLSKSIIAFYDKISEEGFVINFPKLQALNLYELVEKLIGIFGLLQNQPKLEYLFRFMDVILEFNLQKNTTLADFLAYWEEKKHALSINTSKEANAVTVTSIHKSKGLEYPVVIIPFTDWLFTPQTGSTMWVNMESDTFAFADAEGELKMLKAGLVNLNKSLAETEVNEQYHQEMQKTFIENVNMMYVAFTRAVNRLYIISKNAAFDKDGGRKNVNYLLYLYLLHKELWREEDKNFIISEGIPQEKKSFSEQTEENIFWIEEFITTDVHNKLKFKGKGKVE